MKKHKPHIQVKRVYDTPESSDGYRILVDRLWPRGLKKEKAALDEWAKELAPSNPLRKWFGHDPNRWEAFCKKFEMEIKESRALEDFMEKYKDKERITLLFATKDPALTHANLLKEWIEKGRSAQESSKR